MQAYSAGRKVTAPGGCRVVWRLEAVAGTTRLSEGAAEGSVAGLYVQRTPLGWMWVYEKRSAARCCTRTPRRACVGRLVDLHAALDPDFEVRKKEGISRTKN